MSSHYHPPPGPPPTARPSGPSPAKVGSLSETELQQLLSDIKDHQLTQGSLLKLVAFEQRTAVPAKPVAVSALPTPYPRSMFDGATALQRSMSELYMRAAADEQWLHTVMAPLIEHDDLLSALWSVHLRVKDLESVQDVRCGIFRSDYMLHENEGAVSLKQVEMNTFSVAGACHAERVAKMHRHLLRVRGFDDLTTKLPLSNNSQSIIQCLQGAHNLYQPTLTTRPICVLMVVQPYNFNIADERPIEYGLWDANGLCYRCKWPNVLMQTTLTEDRTLLFRPSIAGSREFEVSVVYYRAGYDAKEYDPAGQATRLRLETSKAIKCPDLLTHLTTFKAVQQALTIPNVLERFLPAASVEKVRRTFMPMLPLDTSPAGLAARDIVADPEKVLDYILKPNLEGGGNNVYRDDIPDFLADVPKEQWGKYILMHLIEPPTDPEGMLMTPEELYQGPVVSELGVLGACLWRIGQHGEDIEVLRNEVAGWTFKTKPGDQDEMSVVKGYGCFDCPLLED